MITHANFHCIQPGCRHVSGFRIFLTSAGGATKVPGGLNYPPGKTNSLPGKRNGSRPCFVSVRRPVCRPRMPVAEK